MTTYAQEIARGNAPVAVIKIAGVGDYDGQWSFCSLVPTYASGNALYKPWLLDWPDILREEIQPLGGLAKSGQIVFELLDYQDQLTALFSWDQRAVGEIAVAIDNDDTVLDLGATGFAASLKWIGQECVRVISSAGGTTYNCTRAWLGTTATSHIVDSKLFNANPALLARKVYFYLSFDGTQYSGAETLLGGAYYLDSISMTSDLNAWHLQASSQNRYFSRIIGRGSYETVLAGAATHHNLLDFGVGAPAQVWPRAYDPQWADSIFFAIGEEIVRANAGTTSGLFFVQEHAVCGTARATIAPGNNIRQVFCSHPTLSSFRRQMPGGTINGNMDPDDWTSSVHPVDILACVLTSPRREAIASNYVDSDSGNASCLPCYVGLGIPADEIDWDTLAEVKARTPGHELPWCKIDEDLVGREWLEKNILKICGYDLRAVGGKIVLQIFRPPTTLESATTWSNDQILCDEQGVPRITAKLDTSLLASSVTFRLSGEGQGLGQLTLSDADFGDLFGDLTEDSEDDLPTIEIDAPGVRSLANGDIPSLIWHRAEQIFFRFRRPLWIVELYTSLSQNAVESGDAINLTYAQLPNTISGTRGWTASSCRVLDKEIRIKEGEILWRLVSFGRAGAIGGICPSARIASVAGNTATVAANRYTDSSAFGALPQSDAAAFFANDRVRLVNRNGTIVSTTPAYQTIQSLGANQIVLDGNFGGSGYFAAGTIIEYVNANNAVTAQFSRFAFMSDEYFAGVGHDVGTAISDPWRYAEA